jgi:5-methylthioribose kinase
VAISQSTSIVDIEYPPGLIAYLRTSGRVPRSIEIECRTLSGGVSNKTVLVELSDGRAWVLKQALAKLRVKDDWYSDVARIGREAEGLRWLIDLAPTGATTPLVFADPSQNLLAMQAVKKPHESYKSLLLAGTLSRDAVLDLAAKFGFLLGTIHSRAFSRRQDVAAAFDDTSCFETLRIEPYYIATASREPDSSAFYESLISDTRAARFTLVHGDYSPKNVLVHNDNLVLLDHEVIHWGDGCFDIGFALTHLLCKAHYVGARRVDYRDATTAFWKSYSTTSDVADESRCVRHALACLLGRARGKSPLEYLSAEVRDRQCRAVLTLMRRVPTQVPRLIEEFLQRMQ